MSHRGLFDKNTYIWYKDRLHMFSYRQMRNSMVSYTTVRQRPNQFLACTGCTVDAFDTLFRAFSQAWDAYRKKTSVNAGGGNPKLPNVTDKLFFILFYDNVYPIQ